MSKTTEPRRFDALRDASRKQSPDTLHRKAAKALYNIAETENGEHLRNYLASVIFDTSEPAAESAWRELHARRKFAEQLLAMMDGNNGGRIDRKPRSDENG